MEQELYNKVVEAVHFYASNPSKRCVLGREIRYSGTSLGLDTPGCLIGYLLPQEVRLEMDFTGSPKGISDFYDEEFEPISHLKPKKLFIMLQSWHDNNRVFSEKGLTCFGKDFLEEIIEENDLLNRDDFLTLLN